MSDEFGANRMTDSLFYSFVIYVVAGLLIIVRSMQFRTKLVQFPALAAVVFMLWLLPQFIGLYNSGRVAQVEIQSALLLSCLMLICCWFGYEHVRGKAAVLYIDTVDNKSLRTYGFATIAVGSFFTAMVRINAPEANNLYGGHWTGIITIYVFFSKMLLIGFSILLYQYIKQPRTTLAIALVPCVLLYLDRIVIQGRRADAAEFAVLFALSFWFAKKIMPSKSSILGCLLVGALFILIAGQYRSVMMPENQVSWSGAGLDELARIDVLNDVADLVAGERNFEEAKNLAVGVSQVSKHGDYDYGRSGWNYFVASFLPSQLIGREKKAQLQFTSNDPLSLVSESPVTGSTMTGIYTAYASFWIFGSLLYIVIGLTMRTFWIQATLGSNISRIALIYLTVPALMSITHTVWHFFTGLLQLFFFGLPVLLASKLTRVSQRK